MDEADPGPGYKTFAGFGSGPAGLPFIPSGGLSGWAPGKAPRYLPDGRRPLPSRRGRRAPADPLPQDRASPRPTRRRSPSTSPRSPSTSWSAAPRSSRPGPDCSAGPNLTHPRGRRRTTRSTGTFDRAATTPTLVAVIPHMHWLGKDFTPGRRAARRLEDDADPGRPLGLQLAGHLRVRRPRRRCPRGPRIRHGGPFRQLGRQPRQPERPARATSRWGEQTTDEMCIGFLQLTRDDEHLGNKPPARLAAPTGLGQRGD